MSARIIMDILSTIFIIKSILYALMNCINCCVSAVNFYTNSICIVLSYDCFEGYYHSLCGCLDNKCNKLYTKKKIAANVMKSAGIRCKIIYKYKYKSKHANGNYYKRDINVLKNINLYNDNLYIISQIVPMTQPFINEIT